MEAPVRARLQRLLRLSADPDNPDPEELLDIIARIRTVAVVGMSRNPAKAARRVPSFLSAWGAEIIPVNPHADRIIGREVRPDLGDVTEPVDLVLVFRPSDEAAGVVRQAAGRPEAPAIWLQEGIVAHEAAREAREAGLQVVQDLCIFKVVKASGEILRKTEAPPALT